ncbi:MAG TPA: hypothetical protein VN611_07625 [Patescibacteria group bacterium]|nr:hypothetical protein [Patescibacteria group bacterium]
MRHFTLTIGTTTLNTFPLFVRLAADNPSLYPEIDRLYRADELHYQKASAASPFFDHPSFTDGTIDRQIYARKFLGLLSVALAEDDDAVLMSQLFSLLTKQWFPLYNHICDHSEISLDEVAANPEYHTAANKKDSAQTMLAAATEYYFQRFLSLYPGMDPAPMAAVKFALLAASLLNRCVTVTDPDLALRIAQFDKSSDKNPEMQNLKNRLNQSSVKKMAKQLKNEIFQRIYDHPEELWTNDRFLEGMAHCIAHLSSTEELSLLQTPSANPPRDRDVELLCRLYIVKTTAEWLQHGKWEKNREDIELECTEFVMLGLNLLALVREYKTARRYYFAHNAIHLQAEISTIKERLAASEEELRITKAELKNKSALLATKEKDLHKLALAQQLQIEALEKENRRLSHGVAQKTAAADSPNVVPLHRPAAKYLTSHTLDISADLQKLHTLNAVIIGGAESWQHKLRDHLPHFTYLPGDSSSFDEALIINADIVFANTRCKFNHDAYYKLMRIVRLYQKPITFLSKTNTSLTIHQIAATFAANTHCGEAAISQAE